VRIVKFLAWFEIFMSFLNFLRALRKLLNHYVIFINKVFLF
jgi:hypothetical protein